VPVPTAPASAPVDFSALGKLIGGYTGCFNNGNIAVMDGGILRDGSLTEWPLGNGSTITAKWGSSVLIGPGDRNGNGIDWIDALLNPANFDYGFFIAPENKSSIAVWTNKADQSDGYLDIAAGQVNMNANLTVKKGIGLTYALWIRAGRTLTINIDDGDPLDGGLPIYGVNASSPSTDTATVASKIVIVKGTLQKEKFGGAADITVAEGAESVTLTSTGTTSKADSVFSGVSGYPGWTQN
jgi:hypothetical protein